MIALTPLWALEENGSLMIFSRIDILFSNLKTMPLASSFFKEISANWLANSPKFSFNKLSSVFSVLKRLTLSLYSNSASSNKDFICLIFSSLEPISIAYLRFSSSSTFLFSNFWISLIVFTNLSWMLFNSLS